MLTSFISGFEPGTLKEGGTCDARGRHSPTSLFPSSIQFCSDTISITMFYLLPYYFWLPLENAFKNIVGKGENAGNQHFILFPQYFVYFIKEKLDHLNQSHIVVCKCFQFDQGQSFVVW